MRLSPRLALLLLLVAPCAAYADYEAREKEELDGVSRMELPPVERDRAKDGLSRYFDFRERALLDGLRLLSETSVGDQGSRWNDHFGAAGSDGVRMIEGLVRAETPEALKVRLLGVAQVEAIFWSRIRAMPLASTRDGLVAWNEQFRQERENLRRKWRAQNELDESVDSRTRQVQEDLAGLFTETVKEVAADRQLVVNSLRTLLQLYAKTPGLPLSKVAQGLDELLKLLDMMGSRTADLVSAYADLYRREEAVVIMFADTRAAVRAFVAKTNLSTAQSALADARAQSLDLAGKVAADGARADAAEFATDGLDVVKGHYDRFEDEYEGFVDEFEQIFLGPVGDRTVEDLLERNQWQRWENDMRGRNIEAALADLHGDFTAWQAIVSDASGVTDADKALIQKALREDIDRISRKVTDVRSLTNGERAKLLFDLSFRRVLEDRAKRD